MIIPLHLKCSDTMGKNQEFLPLTKFAAQSIVISNVFSNFETKRTKESRKSESRKQISFKDKKGILIKTTLCKRLVYVLGREKGSL